MQLPTHILNTTNLVTHIATIQSNLQDVLKDNTNKIEANTFSIEDTARVIGDHGVAIGFVIIFLFVGMLYAISNLKESKVEREADRALRQKDHEERVKMNAIRMQREDANTAFLQTAIEKITEAMTRSSLTSERVEQVLSGTAQMHVILDEKVDNIEVKLDGMITDVAKMKSNVQKLKEENEEFMKLLSTLENVERGLLRMEKSLGDVMVAIDGIEGTEETKNTKGVKGK